MTEQGPQDAALSVVVGTCNRLPQLRRCVDSILGPTRTPLRLYVADAGSTDGTRDYLQALAAGDSRVAVTFGEKIGQARALNEVFRVVRTPLTCWLSDDNVVVNDGLDLAASILQTRPRIGMVALKVRDVIGPYAHVSYIGGVSCIGLLNVNQGMLRTAILHRLGGFSEDYRDYGIDPDLTARVLFAGWDVAYTRAVAIHHYRDWHTASDAPEVRRRMERQKQSEAIYARKFATAGMRGSLRRLARKKRLFHLIQTLSNKLRLRGGERLLGYDARDWYHVFHCRYISLFDVVRCLNKPYYLLQRSDAIPRRAAQDVGASF